jgi:hypothetical protein
MPMKDERKTPETFRHTLVDEIQFDVSLNYPIDELYKQEMCFMFYMLASFSLFLSLL